MAKKQGGKQKLDGAARKNQEFASVSEEGLPGGIPDAIGHPRDRSDSATVSGRMASKHAGKRVDGWILDAPTEAVTSSGVAVKWIGSGSSMLRAMAGTTEVATISIDRRGNYAFLLKAPLDHPSGRGENQTSLNFIARASEKPKKGEGILTIRVEDDMPRAAVPVDLTSRPTDSQPVGGNLATAGGADGVFVKSLTIDGTTYAYLRPARGGSGSVATSGGANRGTFDEATQTLTVTTAKGGRFVVDLDGGRYTYERPPALNAAADETMGYVVSDGDGDTTASTVSVRVLLATAPVVAPQSANASEEGLPGANPDSVGSPTDATNSSVVSGTMTAVAAPNAPIVGWTLDAPTQPITSRGVAVQWSGSGTSALIATAGSTEVATLTIDAGGHYVFTSKAPLDHPVAGVEDVIQLSFTARASDGSASGTAALTIRVEDDMPNAALPIDIATGIDDSSPVTGNLFTTGGANPGADGLYVRSLTIDGATYTYAPTAAGDGSVFGSGGAFEAATQTLTVTTAVGGRFIVDLDSGTYRYERPATLNATANEKMAYVLSDRDGDTTASEVKVQVSVAGGGAPVVTIPDVNGDEIGIVEAGPAVAGTIVLQAPAGIALVTIGGTSIGPARLLTLAASPLNIDTGEGTLTLNGFDPATGAIGYSYSARPQIHSGGQPILDSIAVVLVDNVERAVTDSLDIRIGDTAPVARNDAAAVREDGPLTAGAGVFGNDSLGADAARVSGVNGNAGAVGNPVGGAFGSLLLDASGNYVYTLNNALPAVQALNENQSLTDSFAYTLADADGNTSTATLTVTIAGRTDGPPVITIPDRNGDQAGDHTIVEASPTPVTGTIEIGAPDGLASVTVGGTTLDPAQLAALGSSPITVATKGTLVLNGYTAGALGYSYTAAVQNHVDSQPILDSIAVRLVDSAGAVVDDSLQLLITDTGPQAVNDAAAVREDGPLTASANVLGNDARAADGGQVSAVNGNAAAVGSPAPGAYGSLLLNANGSYTYTLNNTLAAVQQLEDGQSLTDSFAYTLADADGTTSIANLMVTIAGTSEAAAPVANPDQNTVREDAVLAAVGNVLANDAPASGAAAVSAVSGTIAGQVGGNTAGAHGTLTLNADGSYRYALDNTSSAVQALDEGRFLADVFSYTLRDAVGSAPSTLTIRIDGSNDGPNGLILSGGPDDDFLIASDGDDTVSGLEGDDDLIGDESGDAGSDTLYGGPGSDFLTGGDGVEPGLMTDVFAWRLNDGGPAGDDRPIDTILDFDVSTVAIGGDILDLRDLLIGEARGVGSTSGNLQNYLDFERDAEAGSTVIRVSTTGGFTGGAYNEAVEDQRIEVIDVDLRRDLGLIATASDNLVVEELFRRGKLVTD